MTSDNSEIMDEERRIMDTVVGFNYKDPATKHFEKRKVTFRQTLEEYHRGTRLEIYAAMREDIEKMNADMQDDDSPFHRDARYAFKKEVLTNSMRLMVEHYLSRGLINNEPYRKRL